MTHYSLTKTLHAASVCGLFIEAERVLLCGFWVLRAELVEMDIVRGEEGERERGKYEYVVRESMKQRLCLCECHSNSGGNKRVIER